MLRWYICSYLLILFSGYGQAQFQGFKSGLSLNLAPNDVSNSRYQIDYLTEKSGLIDDELVAIRARYQAHREETTVGYDRLDFSLHVHLEWLLNDRLSLVSGAILAFTERKTAFSFPQGSTRLVSYEVLEPGSVSSFGTARYSSIEDLARPSGNLVLHQKEKFYMLSLPVILFHQMTDQVVAGLGARYNYALHGEDGIGEHLMSAIGSARFLAGAKLSPFVNLDKTLTNFKWDQDDHSFRSRTLTYRPFRIELGVLLTLKNRVPNSLPGGTINSIVATVRQR